MTTPQDFDDLVAEAASVDVTGWDFSWFAGRATEQRPTWGYQQLVTQRLRSASAVLDVQTGGGEVIAGALRAADRRPGQLTATESWQPNLEIATRALAPWDGTVIHCADTEIPVPPGTFDLVVSRHPTVIPWPSVAAAMTHDGRYLSQQVGRGSVRELTEAMIGPYRIGDSRDPDRTAAAAERAGLTVSHLEVASLPMEFFDIGAVIVFLRKVIWIVPEFSVQRYRPQLLALHERIVRDGPFRATSERFLIECRR